MKFSFSNFSSNILNYFWDISKNVILSIYFLFEYIFFFISIFFSYLESLIFEVLFKKFYLNPNNFFFISLFFFNSRVSNFSSFYLNFTNYLKLDHISKITSDVLIFVSVLTFFSIYIFTGSASVALSNEGLWLIILSLAVIYFFYYLKTLDAAGKDAISSEIDTLKKLMLKNSELSSEVADLEYSVISFQEQVVFVLENWFTLIANHIENAESDSSAFSSQIESILDSVFVDHLKDLSFITLSRENLNKVILLKDFNEEIISEIFENNN